MHRDEGIHLKWKKLPKIVHYVLYVHFAFPVVVLCDRKLLSRLPGICFYTPYLPSTYFAIKSCLSPLPGIYFYTPLLPGTVLQKKKKEVSRFITYVQRFIIYNWESLFTLAFTLMNLFSDSTTFLPQNPFLFLCLFVENFTLSFTMICLQKLYLKCFTTKVSPKVSDTKRYSICLCYPKCHGNRPQPRSKTLNVKKPVH